MYRFENYIHPELELIPNIGTYESNKKKYEQLEKEKENKIILLHKII